MASDDSFARQLRRAERHRRMVLITLALAVASLVFALATRSIGGWVVFLPAFFLVAYRRQVEREEHVADVMKIALNPAVIDQIRREGDSEVRTRQ